MARFLAFFTLFHLSLIFFRPEVPFKIILVSLKLIALKSVQSTLSHLISTSVPRATFTRFFVEHGLFQYYLY